MFALEGTGRLRAHSMKRRRRRRRQGAPLSASSTRRCLFFCFFYTTPRARACTLFQCPAPEERERNAIAPTLLVKRVRARGGAPLLLLLLLLLAVVLARGRRSRRSGRLLVGRLLAAALALGGRLGRRRGAALWNLFVWIVREVERFGCVSVCVFKERRTEEGKRNRGVRALGKKKRDRVGGSGISCRKASASAIFVAAQEEGNSSCKTVRHSPPHTLGTTANKKRRRAPIRAPQTHRQPENLSVWVVM